MSHPRFAYALEDLRAYLGDPPWFDAVLMVILLALMCLAGNNEGGAL